MEEIREIAQTNAENTAKETKPKKKRKFCRIIRNVVLSILGIVVLFVLLTFIEHKCIVAKDMKMLKKAGLVNPVSVGDRSLNAYIYGSDKPKHTIVGISGKGVCDYSVTLTELTDKLADENKIIIIDRAGYGLSDDTKTPQTVENIVTDYRTALKNLNAEAPYILMPHSIGGVYASYWQYKYPEEIEAVIYLDPTELGEIEEDLGQERAFHVTTWEYVEALACKIGLQRPYAYFDKELLICNAPEDKAELSNALFMTNCYTIAQYSETKYSVENMQKVHDMLKPNDVPKLYICATPLNPDTFVQDFKDHIAYMNALKEKRGIDPIKVDFKTVEEKSSEMSEQYAEWADKVIYPYVEMLGNCKFVNIPGDHYIYLHKTDETVKACVEFLAELDAK